MEEVVVAWAELGRGLVRGWRRGRGERAGGGWRVGFGVEAGWSFRGGVGGVALWACGVIWFVVASGRESRDS